MKRYHYLHPTLLHHSKETLNASNRETSLTNINNYGISNYRSSSKNKYEFLQPSNLHILDPNV